MAVRVGVWVEVRVRVAGAEGTLAKITVLAAESTLSPISLTDDTCNLYV